MGGVALFWPLFMFPSLHSCPALIPAAPSLYMCTLLYQYSVLYLCYCSLVLNILSWYFTNPRQSHILLLLLFSNFKYTKLVFDEPMQNKAVRFALDCQSYILLLFSKFKYTKSVFHEPHAKRNSLFCLRLSITYPAVLQVQIY